MKKNAFTVQKPTLPGAAAALAFAEMPANKALPEPLPATKSTSGQVPTGDIRLTANISKEHHIKLKIEAAKRQTTIGELIEQMIDQL